MFSRSGGHKTKETYPTRPGSSTPCKHGLRRDKTLLNNEMTELSPQEYLRSKLQEQSAAYKEQLARIEREKEELRNYKEDDVASFKVALVHHR